MVSPTMGTRRMPVPTKPLCSFQYKVFAAAIKSFDDVFVAPAGLPTKDVTVDIVCSAIHLKTTLRMIGNAVQSERHWASTRLAKLATHAAGETHGESSDTRRHRWSGKKSGPEHI